MKICVIGGSGFIGSRLCRRLAKVSSDFGIVDLVAGDVFSGCTRIADIRELNELREAVTGDVIVHLAAAHRDDIKPVSLYRDVNVEGTANICTVAREKSINTIVFTSSVAIFGFSEPNTGEGAKPAPFNEYGKTKLQAERVLLDWQREDTASRQLVVIRPTVVFGEGNRGNVYNLLRQIQSKLFVMIGRGENRKSMAYVENVAAFIEYGLSLGPGAHVYNYVDKPDMSMTELVSLVRAKLKGKENTGFRIPYVLGLGIGYIADLVARINGKPMSVSSIRVKKFAATTTFDSLAHSLPDFEAPVSLREGLERTLAHEFSADKARNERL